MWLPLSPHISSTVSNPPHALNAQSVRAEDVVFEIGAVPLHVFPIEIMIGDFLLGRNEGNKYEADTVLTLWIGSAADEAVLRDHKGALVMPTIDGM